MAVLFLLKIIVIFFSMPNIHSSICHVATSIKQTNAQPITWHSAPLSLST